MNLLKNLLITELNKSNNLDALPFTIMSEIQKNIRSGAKDSEQQWGNALELVHKAYEVAGVQRPTPDLRNAWKQYEENLSYAVQQLAKFRGMKGDWRMSSHIFFEALQPKPKMFRVTYTGVDGGQGITIESNSIDDVIDALTKDSEFDSKIKKGDKEAYISYSKWGIKKPGRVKIQAL